MTLVLEGAFTDRSIYHIRNDLIADQTQLSSLSFANLQSVGEGFNVSQNESLTSMTFADLQTVAGLFSVWRNAALEEMAFAALEEVGGDFWVEDNETLTSMSFNNLQTVGGYFRVEENKKLTSMTFSDLETNGVGWYVEVKNNEALQEMTFSESIQAVIEKQERCRENDDDNTLGHIYTGDVFMSSDGVFTTTVVYDNDGFPERNEEGHIKHTPSQNIIQNFDQYCIVEGGVLIDPARDNAFTNTSIYHIRKLLDARQTKLSSLSFANLQSVGGSVNVQSNGDLEEMSFAALETVAGFFRVKENVALNSMTFAALEEVEGYFDVRDNAALSSMTFAALQSVGGYFWVEDNETLSSMTFADLKEVGGGFDVIANGSLTLMTFNTLHTVGGILVQNNTALGNGGATINFTALKDDGITSTKAIQSPIGGVSSGTENAEFPNIQAVITAIGNDAGTFVITPSP